MSTEDTFEDLDSQIQAEETVENTEEETPAEVEFTESERKLFARAKAAEDKLKDARKKLAEATLAPKKLETNAVTSSDELRLIAKGYSDEEIEEAKAIARGKDIGLMDALKEKSFLAFQRELKEDARKEEARLGATKGSGQVNKETFRPGMTPAEHRALYDKTHGA